MGFRFAPGLVSRIVDDLLDQFPADRGHVPATTLPLLGITLWQLGERAGADRTISPADYTWVGGFGGALTRWANTVFDAADGAESRALDQVLLRLVRIGEGENTPSTGEFVAREDLLALTRAACRGGSGDRVVAVGRAVARGQRRHGRTDA